MRAHKKFLGLQGLAGITLVIPALFVFYFYQTGSFVKESLMYGPLDASKLYPRSYVKPHRSYITFTCNGNPAHDKDILHKFFLSSQKMMQDNDTVRGVKIKFEKDAKYDSFIKALNVFHKTRVARYSFEDNSLLAINTSAYEIKKTNDIFEEIYGVYEMGPE